MPRFATAIVFVLAFSLAKLAWTNEAEFAVDHCLPTAKKGAQICQVKGHIGQAGQDVSAYNASSHWVATGTIESVKKGVATVRFDESTALIRAGYRVTNNEQEEQEDLSWRHSFSRPDVSF